MRVKSGARKDGRLIEVELDSEDGESQFSDWKILTTADRFKRLTAEADTLVVYYLAREGLISTDLATQRVREIRDGR